MQNKFGVRSIRGNEKELTAAVYLQVSIVSQALIFVTRSRSWSFVERPGVMLMIAFLIAQLVSTKKKISKRSSGFQYCLFCCIFCKNYKLILYSCLRIKLATVLAVYANWGFARIKGMGWGWAGVIWLYSIVTYIPLDILKFMIRYALSGKAWDTVLENKVLDRTLMLKLCCHSSRKTFYSLFDCFSFLCRLPSQQRRITERERGRHNGQQLNEPCTGCSLPKHLNSSMTRTTTESCLR